MTRRRMLVLVSVVALLAVVGIGYVAYRAFWPRSQPDAVTVLIDAPGTQEVVTVGRPTTVHAVASGEGRIARVELWVDGELATATEASVPGGVSPLPLLASWEPAQAGAHTLVARAFDATGARSAATRAIEVVEPEADRDGDAVADTSDACPDEPGFASAGGCPDRDGDAVADAADACPDDAGMGTAAGCPVPATGDADGDGTSDPLDVCGDVPGGGSDGCAVTTDPDGDGVPTADDRCPEAAGTAAGCPDADGDAVADVDDPCRDVAGAVGGCPGSVADDGDGDGLPDAVDACPDEVGPAEAVGCPGEPPGAAAEEADVDSDGDGVPDAADRCPGDPGAEASLGCPAEDASDGDGDGVADAVDPCPDEPGASGGAGCPEPSEDRALSPGTGRMLLPASARVEFQAVGMQVSDDYDGLVCYPSLAGAPVQRYAFESVGGTSWQAPADLASQVLLVPEGEPLAVAMECGADVTYLDAEQPWGTYWGIGSIEAEHPETDWDGRTLTQRSTGGDDGRWFEVQYRLCSGSCADPVAKGVFLVRDGDQLLWSWEEEEDGRDVAAYAVYVDGTRVRSVWGGQPLVSMDASAYAPSCGTSRDFTVTAVYADGTESEPSNTVTWAGEACPRIVRVTFDHLTTFDLGSDQGSPNAGPIYGSFSATGSSSEVLAFNGLDRGDWWGEDDRGFRLSSRTTYPVQDIFDRIGTWIANSWSSPYSAPERDWVTVDLGSQDDLTFGGTVGDGDQGSNPDDTLFDGDLTLPAADVRPGTYRIVDRNIALTVVVDVIVGPEVSGDPDLAITEVEPGPEGSVNITVFNNAAPMPQAADLAVQWTDLVTGDVVDTQTWPDVQLGSGATAILQTTDPVPRPGGKRFVLDPGGRLPDANPDNNVFDTPVPLRVELVRAAGAQCSEARCTILSLANCEAEWSFMLWVGTGAAGGSDTDREAVEWVRHLRLPQEGVLIGCDEDLGCTPAGSPPEDWSPDGAEPYRVDLEVPAWQWLYVDATATEADVATADDAFSAAQSGYGGEVGWGARSEPYTARLSPERSCDDSTELVCDECAPGEVSVTWRITRLD